MTTQPTRTRQPETEPRTAPPKPAYRGLFLAPDLPDTPYDDEELDSTSTAWAREPR